jgi:hypothetical protein
MFEKVNQRSRIITVVLFLIMLVVGLIVTPNYGMPWDELMEIQIMGSNVREYVGLVKGEENEPDKLANGMPIQDFKENPDIDHGESAYYPIAPFAFMDLGQESGRTLMFIWHFYTFLIFMAGVICLYFIAKFLTGDWKYGILASLFLYLSPRFFAEGHYNSKDVVTMCLIIIGIWFGIKFIETKFIRYAAAFAAACAVAANMRIIGFMFFGGIGLLYLVVLTMQKQWSRKSIISGAIAILAFAAIYYVLTPASWESPIRYFSYNFTRSSNFEGWPGTVYFMGQTYRPVPSHYIPVMFAITTPILIVFLTLVGHITTVKKIWTTKVKEFFAGSGKYYLCSLLFVWVPLMFAIIKTPILYNSWRHFYFIYGPLLILAIGGFKAIVDISTRNQKRLICGLLALQIGFSIVMIAINHPYEYAYYNILAGAKPDEKYEMDYWNVTGMKCLMELIDKVDSPEVISVVGPDYYMNDGLHKAFDVLPKEYQSRIKILEYSEGSTTPGADYLVVNQVTKAYLPNYEKYRTIVLMIRSYGSEVMTVYDVR